MFPTEDPWFTGVVMTDGSGSPRHDLYKEYTDEAMRQVRFKEQKKAAIVGEYAAQVMLDYPSKVIKDGLNLLPIEDLAQILKVAHPHFVYTHNLADKHDTHVGAVLKVITAIRNLPEGERPQKLFGCEVWRDLDWMVDSDKVAFDLTSHGNLQEALLGVFDSQTAVANAMTWQLWDVAVRLPPISNSHGVDETTGLSYSMDLNP